MSFKLKIKYPNCNLQVRDIVTREHCLQNNVIPENYPDI